MMLMSVFGTVTTKTQILMKNKQPQRTYYVRYTVQAGNAVEALRVSKKRQPDDIYTIEDEAVSTHAIGFHAEEPYDEWE